MASSPDPRSSETVPLIVGIALAFLGATLIALVGSHGGLAFVAAVLVTVAGLGLLLRGILRLLA